MLPSAMQSRRPARRSMNAPLEKGTQKAYTSGREEAVGVQVEWDDGKRQHLLRERGLDLLYAARIFDGPVFTWEDSRQDYGERRWTPGLVDGEAFVVVHTDRNGVTRLITAWKGGRHDLERYQAGIARRAEGDAGPGGDPPGTPPARTTWLPDAFWKRRSSPRPARKSVHLKLEPEVFEFFKQGGKGHLTRMQNVLAAYARARKQAGRTKISEAGENVPNVDRQSRRIERQLPVDPVR